MGGIVTLEMNLEIVEVNGCFSSHESSSKVVVFLVLLQYLKRDVASHVRI